MPIYLYKAKKGPGEVLEGQIEAPGRQEALARIDSLGLFPIYVEEKQVSLKIPSKVSLKELVEWTQQLSTLIGSGSTLLVSLNTLVFETEQFRLKPVILDVIFHVKEGEDFSEALKRHPRIFPRIYTSLVKIGETSGTLGQNLKRIAEFLEEELDFKNNLLSILTYPLLIIGVGILTVFILLKFIIPKLVIIFEEIGQVLPLPTLLLINISHFFSKYWFFIMGFIILLFFAVRRYFKDIHNRLRWDRFKLNIPLCGNLLKKIEVCKFARTLSLLLKNGVPLDSSLKVLAATVSNLYFQQEIGRIGEKIKEGAFLSETMKATKVFGPTFINVVTVGEDSGTLETVLDNLSNDYNKDIDRSIKNLLNLLGPFLLLTIGVMVAFVVLSMLLPIFQIDFNF